MAKWQFNYTRLDGMRGQVKISASNKPDAIKKGIEHARKRGNGEQITHWDCRLVQA